VLRKEKKGKKRVPFQHLGVLGKPKKRRPGRVTQKKGRKGEGRGSIRQGWEERKAISHSIKAQKERLSTGKKVLI